MFWENYKKLCDSIGKTPTCVAKEMGFSNATPTHWKNGKMPNSKTIGVVADYFNVSSDYLQGRTDPAKDDPLPDMDNILPITRKRFPLLGEIACGQPIYADEDRESYIISGTDVQADFCLKAKGDSMTGARILDGDIVFIKALPIVENGSVAAVIIGDEATLKRIYYYPDKQKLVLNAENPKYEPIVLLGEELNTVRILGKAIAFQSDVK